MHVNETTTTTTTGTMSQLLERGLQSARNINPIHLELTWIVLGYGFWASRIHRSNARAGYAKVFGIPRSVLLIHTLGSLLEIARYYIPLGLTGQRPTATPLDLALCLAQAVTSLWLAANLYRIPRGEYELTRATFQCMALQRVFATGAALLAGNDPDGLLLGVAGSAWHTASTKLLQNFVTSRFILEIIAGYMTGLDTYGSRYTAAILGCHLLGLWEGDWPNGIVVYFGLMFALLGFDRWAQKFESNAITRALTTAGFITRAKTEKATETKAAS